MAVMRVRIMRVRMSHRRVHVPMGMRLARRVARSVRMPVMIIVNMGVLMLQGVVLMLMRVCLGEMQPNAKRH